MSKTEPAVMDEMAALGDTTWHSSGEDEGPDVGVSIALANGCELWCGEITKARWEDAGEDAAALGNDFGTWLILYGRGETVVIGKAVNQAAAYLLAEQIAGTIHTAMGLVAQR